LLASKGTLRTVSLRDGLPCGAAESRRSAVCAGGALAVRAPAAWVESLSASVCSSSTSAFAAGVVAALSTSLAACCVANSTKP
jgi:hypothetical protein